jgi:hypothetical protein
MDGKTVYDHVVQKDLEEEITEQLKKEILLYPHGRQLLP